MKMQADHFQSDLHVLCKLLAMFRQVTLLFEAWCMGCAMHDMLLGGILSFQQM